MKLAAFEGLQDTTKSAPFHLGGYYSEDDQKLKGGVEIPKLLSVLAFHDPNATVKGLEIVPKDDRPPVNIVRFAFLTMAGIGSLLAALAAWFLWLRARRRFPESIWFWRAVVAAGPLSLVALISGWVTTEVGRQPWVVYGLMRTEDAVTGAGGIPVGYATLAVVYLALIVGTIWILRRLAHTPLEEAKARPPDSPPRGRRHRMTEIPMVLILVGLAAYAVLGGADFGAGFWELFARGPARRRGPRADASGDGSGLGGKPRVAHLRAGGLLDGLSDGVCVDHVHAHDPALPRRHRNHHARCRLRLPDRRSEWARSGCAALDLLAVVGAHAVRARRRGRRDRVGPRAVGKRRRRRVQQLAQPHLVPVGSLAVASAAYTAAVYLAGDAKREGLHEMSETFRRRALISGAVVGAIAVCGPLVLHEDAKPLYDGLSSGWGLAAGFASGIAGVATLALVWRRRFEPARASAALAVGAIIAGWALAQEPYFLPPDLTLEEAAAEEATLVAVVVSVGLGLLILLPSLALLFRLVLSGRFDPGRELQDAPAGTAGSARPPIPLAAVAAVAGIGAAVTFLSEGWLLYVGLAVMLAGMVLAFLVLAAPEEGT